MARQPLRGSNPNTRPGAKPKARLTHVAASGEAAMVDVTEKRVVLREAVAEGHIRMARATLQLVMADKIAKGNVLATARLAGILAAKRTGELIPLCHPLPITHCEVELRIPPSLDRIEIRGTARIAAVTGVEMEALTAVSVAALTLYDMCKAVDKRMRIGGIRLVSKTKRPLPPLPG
ncbi:MAG TPA: cyclic pyranopterin monophosphate synthase MoaC [Verrucomicrobiales bacterium]|nr:cyclic pyranopterin monophosphate synthase MoaC [Verrucomicrobiales bacterium]